MCEERIWSSTCIAVLVKRGNINTTTPPLVHCSCSPRFLFPCPPCQVYNGTHCLAAFVGSTPVARSSIIPLSPHKFRYTGSLRCHWPCSSGVASRLPPSPDRVHPTSLPPNLMSSKTDTRGSLFPLSLYVAKWILLRNACCVLCVLSALWITATVLLMDFRLGTMYKNLFTVLVVVYAALLFTIALLDWRSSSSGGGAPPVDENHVDFYWTCSACGFQANHRDSRDCGACECSTQRRELRYRRLKDFLCLGKVTNARAF